jgi:hypothetical protein
MRTMTTTNKCVRTEGITEDGETDFLKPVARQPEA